MSKMKIKKIFLIPYSSFIMIPVSTLHDEYIDRPKLTEQKKPSGVYISSPSRGVGTIKWPRGTLFFLQFFK